MKKNFFKSISFLMVALNILFLISCGNNEKDDDKPNIVCTAFPQYDFVKEILGEKIEDFNVEYLFSNGADVHSFENDIGYDKKIKILKSDIFIYNGGESDGCVKDIINDKSMNSTCKTISMIDCIDKKNLIHNNENHVHDTSCDEEHSHLEYDEHVWLSLENAIKICNKISENIIDFDSNNKEIYESNTAKYIDKLNELKSDFSKEFSSQNDPFVVVADRFPFKYLFSEFEISYSAAFSGCTAETEASYDSIIRLVEDVSKHNLKSVIVLEKSNSNISDSIINASNRTLDIYRINSLQSVSDDEIKNGLTYYTAMKENLDSIKKSLVK
jgi:zinc transport system substrate-binding protein